MCNVHSTVVNTEVVSRRIVPRGLQHFRLNDGVTRQALQDWLATLGENVPFLIRSLFTHCHYGDFVDTENKLNVSLFMIFLFFFEVNHAPAYIRQLFWVWVLPSPDVTNRIGLTHLYIHAMYLEADFLERCFAFFNVTEGVNVTCDTWQAFNIWNWI